MLPRCRNETWLESMPPSIACSQLHSCSRLETKRCSAGTSANSHSGSGGWRSGGPMIGPQHAAALDQRIGLELDALGEAALLGLRRHLDALAGDVELPAVIGAAQPAFLVAPEPQRDAAMRAELVDQAEPSLAVAERDEPLGQHLDPHRRTVVLGQLLGEQHRHPVAAEQCAHRRARPGLGDEIVLFFSEHARPPGRWLRMQQRLPVTAGGL